MAERASVKPNRNDKDGDNRLELLLFRLGGRQKYGINVFKVQEVIHYTALTHVPGSHPLVSGIANLRGRTMSILDLSSAIGGRAIADPEHSFIILTEYNRSMHGFLVNSVEKIVDTRWERVLPPPKGTGRNHYLTAVTVIDGDLVEIIDVEKVLDQVVRTDTAVSDELQAQGAAAAGYHVLVVDDSSVARNQIKRSLGQLGIECTTANDGKEALELLAGMAERGEHPAEYFGMIISDIEMPEMDGYTLTEEIRAMPAMQKLFILLHSSLSGVFNSQMVERCGADAFLQKYNPDDLAKVVLERLGRDK